MPIIILKLVELVPWNDLEAFLPTLIPPYFYSISESLLKERASSNAVIS